MGIVHKTTSLYNPSGNGAVERFNRVIKGVIQFACNSRLNWEIQLHKAVWAYRVTKNDCTGLSPFVMMRGRKPRSKYNPVWLNSSFSCHWSPSSVRSKIIEHHAKVKAYCDDKHGAKTPTIDVGDWVRIKKPGKVKKGESQFFAPEEVVEVLNNAVRVKSGKVWNMHSVA